MLEEEQQNQGQNEEQDAHTRPALSAISRLWVDQGPRQNSPNRWNAEFYESMIFRDDGQSFY